MTDNQINLGLTGEKYEMYTQCTRLSIAVAAFLLASAPIHAANITADFSDATVDFEGNVDTTGQLIVSDELEYGDGEDDDRRALIKFDLSSVADKVIPAAELRMTIQRSVTGNCDCNDDTTPDFDNNGMSVSVLQVPDYGTAEDTDFDTAPLGVVGTIINGAGGPVPKEVSIDVTAWVLQAIEAGEQFVAFRLQPVSNNNGAPDAWHFQQSENQNQASPPYIAVTTAGTAETSADDLQTIVGFEAPIFDPFEKPLAPINFIGTITGVTGGEPMTGEGCQLTDPRYNKVSGEWTDVDLHLSSFAPTACDVEGFEHFDNIIPKWWRPNINSAGDAVFGLIAVNTGSVDGFEGILSGQPRWENVGPDIRIDECFVPIPERDVDLWSTLPNEPYFEVRKTEGQMGRVVTGSCNRSRTLARRGTLWIGPGNVTLPPEVLFLNQVFIPYITLISAEAKVCIDRQVRKDISKKLFQAAFATFWGVRWFGEDAYGHAVNFLEEAAALVAFHSPGFDCSYNIGGDLRATILAASFTAFDKLWDQQVTYNPPGVEFPPDPVEDIVQ